MMTLPNDVLVTFSNPCNHSGVSQNNVLCNCICAVAIKCNLDFWRIPPSDTGGAQEAHHYRKKLTKKTTIKTISLYCSSAVKCPEDSKHHHHHPHEKYIYSLLELHLWCLINEPMNLLCTCNAFPQCFGFIEALFHRVYSLSTYFSAYIILLNSLLLTSCIYTFVTELWLLLEVLQVLWISKALPKFGLLSFGNSSSWPLFWKTRFVM